MSIDPVTSVALVPATDRLAAPLAALPGATVPTAFADMLINGIDRVNTQLMDADQLVRNFALDDSIPVHQVTFALEQARLSFELMLQVRTRLVEGYQQLMNMQL